MITGNYNAYRNAMNNKKIIPYQVITGNYNKTGANYGGAPIIPYQVITGNYNDKRGVNKL